MTGVTETDACPFASCPDFTGCDCDCNLPMPRSWWGRIKRCLTPWCVSGFCGCGLLPCKRFSEWKRECESAADATERQLQPDDGGGA